MKLTAKIVVGIMAAALLSGALAAADRTEDFKTFQKAVKANPSYEPGREIKWFKIEVTDARTRKSKVRITLPIALVDIALKCVDNSRIHLDDSDCDIDIKALWREMKKAGPMFLIEISEDDELVKVWFE
jgi:hypothetical protein